MLTNGGLPLLLFLQDLTSNEDDDDYDWLSMSFGHNLMEQYGRRIYLEHQQWSLEG
jgi:hypothetical protein